ncbi:MAG: M20/M25/M40 family metallo-hydrolase [Telluria sp.]
MTLLRPAIHAAVLLIVIALPGALHAQTSALSGHWQFETATGTTMMNGAEVELIDKGTLAITYDHGTPAATISWLDDQGQITSTRQVNGTVGPAGTVFRHTGKRVTRGSGGKETSVEVGLRWTLRAEGDRLIGERLVETDENEPKAITGTRLKAAYVAPPRAATQLPQAERGPATAEERKRVVRLARNAHTDPLAAAIRDGAWLRQWVQEVPDVTLNPGVVDGWLTIASKPELREALDFQYMASAMAAQIEKPEIAGNQTAIELSGLEGVLIAYDNLLRKNSQHRTAKLDAAIMARNQGNLAAFTNTLSGRNATLTWSPSRSQDPAVRRIVALGMSEPRAMDWLDILSNRFGGRMAGSDAYTHAARWARNELQQWGTQSVLEDAGTMPVGFNRGPSMGAMLAPQQQALRFITPAFTAGTQGVQRGDAVMGPSTLEEARSRVSQFRGKWVLIGGESSGTGRDGEYAYKPRAIMKTLMEAGAIGTIQSGEEPLYAASGAPATWDTLPTMPDVKLAAQQYADIRQRVMAGTPVTLAFDIRNGFYPGPVVYQNVVATIPGSARPEEIVLLGAHLDSFDGGTGAADNGSNVAVMMEAMRLLATSGVKPRRTIMMAAFGGEEIGRKGSFAFAAQHGARMKDIVMMLNRDGRPGAVMGLTVPSAWKAPLSRVEQALEGVHPTFGFATMINDQPRDANKAMNSASGSDDAVFSVNRVPTPRFAVLSDFNYGRVHHTALDTYENVLPYRAAQQYSAVAIAVLAYEIANAPEPISGERYYKPAKKAN